MKKKYIKPEMQVYEVGTQQLLAGSGTESESVVIDYSDSVPDDYNEYMWWQLSLRVTIIAYTFQRGSWNTLLFRGPWFVYLGKPMLIEVAPGTNHEVE